MINKKITILVLVIISISGCDQDPITGLNRGWIHGLYTKYELYISPGGSGHTKVKLYKVDKNTYDDIPENVLYPRHWDWNETEYESSHLDKPIKKVR